MATQNGCQRISTGTTAASNKILTKNTNRGFQIRKVPKTTVEQERVLRDQLHEEIEQKTKACSNIVYDCSLPRIDGCEFCLKHILQDPKAPYKQCCYTYPRSGKRCVQPAPKKDVYTNFCFEHSRQTQLAITKSKCGTFRSVETNDTLLRELSHHVDAERRQKPLGAQSNYVDPYAASALNYASDDSSYVEVGEECSEVLGADDSMDQTDCLSNVGWHGQDLDQSDNESVDSQNEDYLKHAGIYTTEEATVITKRKMTRLQQLYIEQIHRLHYLLKQKRRICLQNLRVERETLAANTAAAEKAAQAAAVASGGAPLPTAAILSTTLAQPRPSPRQRALNKYLKRCGVEEIMHIKSSDLRTVANNGSHQNIRSATSFATSSLAPGNKCTYSEGGFKCGERAMPCTKFCRKHIFEDKKQILYRPCNIEKSGVVCQEPVPDIFDNTTCVLHIELPPQRDYTQKHNESDYSEDEAEQSDAAATSNDAPSHKLAPSISIKSDMKMELDEGPPNEYNTSGASMPNALTTTTTVNGAINSNAPIGSDQLKHMDIVVDSFESR